MDFSVLADRDCLVAFAAVVLCSDRGVSAHKRARLLQSPQGPPHGYHLHQFETACGTFGRPDDDDWGLEDVGDEFSVALARVIAEEKVKIVYVYDFGDDWRARQS